MHWGIMAAACVSGQNRGAEKRGGWVRETGASAEFEMQVGRQGKNKGLEEEIQFPMITFVTMQLGSYN